MVVQSTDTKYLVARYRHVHSLNSVFGDREYLDVYTYKNYLQAKRCYDSLEIDSDTDRELIVYVIAEPAHIILRRTLLEFSSLGYKEEDY